MSWSTIAEHLWLMREWMPIALIALYLVPLSRLATLFLCCSGHSAMRFNRWCGVWEHLVHLFRDTLIALYLAGAALWHGWQGVAHNDVRGILTSLVCLGCIALGLFMCRLNKRAHRDLLMFVEHFPTIHPQEFFDHVLCCSGAIRHRLPDRPFATVDLAALDFRSRRKQRWGTHWRVIVIGAWSTMWLARLILEAKVAGDDARFARVASSLAAIWGARLCQLARAAVTIEGRAQLPLPGGLQLFLFTHGSFLDFALAPLVLAARPGALTPPLQSGSCLPRFLLAKDHFRDNILFYRILGIGRVAEALGMLFVERSTDGTPERAHRVTQAAAAQLVHGQGALAIFPQGTRARAYRGATGERLDAAYYTVGSPDRIKADGQHLKKGAAHIAAAVAEAVAYAGSREPVRIVPIAIAGAATVCPRGTMRIQQNVYVRLLVGESVLVPPTTFGPCREGETPHAASPPLSREAFVSQLHTRIDVSLKMTGRVHAELERRFFEDMRGLIEPMAIEEVAIALKPWRGDDFLVHAILDAIYACPKHRWRTFAGELVHLLLNFTSREELLAFKGRIADALPR